MSEKRLDDEIIRLEDFALFGGYTFPKGEPPMAYWIPGTSFIQKLELLPENTKCTVNKHGVLSIEPIQKEDCFGGFHCTSELWARMSDLDSTTETITAEPTASMN